jgi:hypothetical protein
VPTPEMKNTTTVRNAEYCIFFMTSGCANSRDEESHKDTEHTILIMTVFKDLMDVPKEVGKN